MSFVQNLQVTYKATLEIAVTLSAGRDIRFKLWRQQDNYLYDPTDATFKPAGNVVTPLITLLEAPAGTYTYLLDASGFVDGTYLTDVIEIFGADQINLYVQQSEYLVGSNPLAILGHNLVQVNHNTGGVNNLKYVTSAGDPIDDAAIYAYTKANYDAGNTEHAMAISKTNNNGEFLYPLLLPAGQTYILVFQRLNLYGPDAVQVTL